MKSKLEKIHSDALEEMAKISDMTGVEDFKNEYLSRKSELTNIKKQLKDLSNEEKRIIGPLANSISNDLEEKFITGVKNLTKLGIDEKLVIDNSLITSSCGAGSLSEKYAQKAMDLINELAQKLKERF